MAEAVATRQPAQVKAEPKRTMSAPTLLRASPHQGIGCLQRARGNQSMQRLLRSGIIQTKPSIGPANDEYERAPDRVADTVMRIPDPAASVAVREAANSVQRAGDGEGKREEGWRHALWLQRHATGSSAQRSAPVIVSDVVRSPGRGLDHSTRIFMERRFGADFSSVQVHTDSKAAESARTVNARAYTVGRDLVFGSGEYLPHSQSGRHLLAHELTHVLQQEGRDPGLVQRATCESGILGDARCADAQGSGHGAGTHVEQFDNDRHRLKPSHLAAIGSFKVIWDRGGGRDNVEIHGYASCEGMANANADLSCRRAEAIKAELVKRGITTSIATFAHGETDEFGASPDANRRAIIRTVARPKPVAAPPPALPKTFPPLIRFWYHAFIPMNVSGARRAPAGPFAGRTVFPSPPLPFHLNSCFETDDRMFSSVPRALSRVRVEALFDTASSGLIFSSASDLTFEIDCTSGARKCAKVPSPLTGLFVLPKALSSPSMDTIVMNTSVNDPCVTGSPDLAIRGVFTIDRATRKFSFQGATTLYPAFEMFVDFGAGPVTMFIQPPIVDSPFALFAPGLNVVTSSVFF